MAVAKTGGDVMRIDAFDDAGPQVPLTGNFHDRL